MTPQQTPKRHAWPRLAGLLIGALVLIAAGVVIVDRGAFHVWPWSTYPTRLHVCGRDFQPVDAVETRAQIQRQGYHLIRHGDVPGWPNDAPVWTFDTSGGQLTTALPGGCHVVMWVQGGSDSFKPYSLEGGA